MEPLINSLNRLTQIYNEVNSSPHSKGAFGRIFKWYKYQEHKKEIQEIMHKLTDENFLMGQLKSQLNEHPEDIQNRIANFARNEQLLLKTVYGEDVQKKINDIGKWAFMGHSRTIEKGEDKAIQMMRKLNNFAHQLDPYHERYLDKVKEVTKEKGYAAERLGGYVQGILALLNQFDQEFDKVDPVIAEFKNIFEKSFKDDIAILIEGFSDQLKEAVDAETQMLHPQENDRKKVGVEKTSVMETFKETLNTIWRGIDIGPEYHTVFEKLEKANVDTNQQGISPEQFIRQQDLQELDSGNDNTKLLINVPLERFKKLHSLYLAMRDVMSHKLVSNMVDHHAMNQQIEKVKDSLRVYFSQIEIRHKEYQSHLIKQLTPSNFLEIKTKIESLNRQFAEVYSIGNRIFKKKKVPDFSSVLFEELKIRQEALAKEDGVLVHGQHLRELIGYILQDPRQFSNSQITQLVGNYSKEIQVYREKIKELNHEQWPQFQEEFSTTIQSFYALHQSLKSLKSYESKFSGLESVISSLQYTVREKYENGQRNLVHGIDINNYEQKKQKFHNFAKEAEVAYHTFDDISLPTSQVIFSHLIENELQRQYNEMTESPDLAKLAQQYQLLGKLQEEKELNPTQLQKLMDSLNQIFSISVPSSAKGTEQLIQDISSWDYSKKEGIEGKTQGVLEGIKQFKQLQATLSSISPPLANGVEQQHEVVKNQLMIIKETINQVEERVIRENEIHQQEFKKLELLIQSMKSEMETQGSLLTSKQMAGWETLKQIELPVSLEEPSIIHDPLLETAGFIRQIIQEKPHQTILQKQFKEKIQQRKILLEVTDADFKNPVALLLKLELPIRKEIEQIETATRRLISENDALPGKKESVETQIAECDPIYVITKRRDEELAQKRKDVESYEKSVVFSFAQNVGKEKIEDLTADDFKKGGIQISKELNIRRQALKELEEGQGKKDFDARMSELITKRGDFYDYPKNLKTLEEAMDIFGIRNIDPTRVTVQDFTKVIEKEQGNFLKDTKKINELIVKLGEIRPLIRSRDRVTKDQDMGLHSKEIRLGMLAEEKRFLEYRLEGIEKEKSEIQQKKGELDQKKQKLENLRNSIENYQSSQNATQQAQNRQHLIQEKTREFQEKEKTIAIHQQRRGVIHQLRQTLA